MMSKQYLPQKIEIHDEHRGLGENSKSWRRMAQGMTELPEVAAANMQRNCGPGKRQ